ncbi:MAG: septum formation protein Maf [Candidatus Marinimicrobia bacterium]|nr:septum formation protein Maf [Candidatus Neomarinimicrobiota bacterium]|tara:strand:+ start:3530 stop:4102 length:573 start_codon:yes stop_codon:yes gene_type:complete
MRENILASESPRRKMLLNQIGFQFSVIPSHIVEYNNSNIPPEALTESLAREKALKIAQTYNDKIVIGADTIVFFGNKIIGKPKDKNESFNILKSLSGKTHEVITGVSILKLNQKIDCTFNERTYVSFLPLSDKDILSYVNKYQPYDKAGSYGIQDGFSIHINRINGCYYNVMGFPLSSFYKNYCTLFQNT